MDETPDEESGWFRPFEVYLSEKSRKQLSHEMSQLFLKYRIVQEEEIKLGLKLKPVSGVLGILQFVAWKKVYLDHAKTIDED